MHHLAASATPAQMFCLCIFFDRILPGEEIQLCLFITFSPENVSFQVEKELETK